MFCNSSVMVHNVLRSFRSHKNLKHQRQLEQDQDMQQYTQLPTPVHHQRPVPTVASHPRRPSEASSIETLNSDISYHRPLTSRRQDSVEINPLRLHPLTEDFDSPRASLRSPPRHHYERQHLGSIGSRSSNESHEMDRPSLSFDDFQAQLSGSLEIHDGFDFGFEFGRGSGHTTGGGGGGGGGSGGGDYFGMQPKSHWSRSPTPTPGTSEGEEDDVEDATETPGAMKTPDESGPRLRSRPPEGLDSPEYFMKRGDWKRRGIVFTIPVPIAGAEETFDLEG